MENQTAPVQETAAKDTLKQKKEEMKKDKQYKLGRRVYNTGSWLMFVYLLMFAAKTLLKADLVVGEVFLSTYLCILVIVPIALMIIGLIISDKASKRFGIEENNKTWIAVMSIAGVVMTALAICEMLMPGYKIYKVDTVENARPGQELVAVEFTNGTIFNPAPAQMPAYHYVDVYGKYGILAVRKADAVCNGGTYKVEQGSGSNDYTLVVSSLGREESFKFEY